jgi:hypothetical protein
LGRNHRKHTPNPLKPICEIWIELIRGVGRSCYVRAVNGWQQIFFYDPEGNVIEVHHVDQN